MDKENSFADITIREFAGRLGSGDPTPGGGAAAALQAALGAALVMMVANLTIGKPRYSEFEELNRKILEEAGSARSRLLEGIDRDAEAFGRIASAYAMPKDLSGIAIDRVSAEIERLRSAGYEIAETGDEGMTAEILDQLEAGLMQDREKAIAAASVEASEAPLSVMQDALQVLRLAAVQKGRSNRNLESDIVVAARSLHAAILSSNINVEANLPAIEKADAALAAEMRGRAAAMVSEAGRITPEITD